MDKYFTFFFCALRWRNKGSGSLFANLLIAILDLRSPLTVVARKETGRKAPEFPAKGDYRHYKDSLEQLEYDRLIITNERAPKEGLEVQLSFEQVHTAAKYLSGPSSTALGSTVVMEEVPDGIKTFTFSIRGDIWQSCLKDKRSSEIIGQCERLFATLSCLYGYGHPTPLPHTGMFNLIWGNSKSGYPRVMDFDYARAVERVCQYNFLSETQLAGTTARECLRCLADGVRCRDIKADDETTVGLGVYLPAYSPMDVSRVEQCLGPLLWRPQESAQR